MRKPFQIVLLALVATACASSGGNAGADAGLIRSHPAPAEGGMSAIVQGTVEVDLEMGCVWLSTSDGARHPIVWPYGTTAREDPFEIALADGQSIRDGDLVSGGGGYVSAESATGDMAPFAQQCVQDGQAAVFNADTELQVTAGGGDEPATTLVGRFSIPESIGLELIAVNPNRKSVAVADFVAGTVHLYQTSDYEGPSDAIDGASGGGGFIHLWSQGKVYSYPGRLTDEPLVYEPEELNTFDGVAPVLEVLPAPDGEHTWLVQDGAGYGPTLIDLVNLVEVQVTRLFNLKVDGSWQPFGTTNAGLVLVSNEGEPRTLLVGVDGSVGEPVSGEPLSVGWAGVVILEDGVLRVTGPALGSPNVVDQPVPGKWASVGGPVIPADAPPMRTGGVDHLVALVAADDPESAGLVVVGDDGSARVVHEIEGGTGVGLFSRAGDWIALVDQQGVTLIPTEGEPVSVGEVIPPDHWVLAGG